MTGRSGSQLSVWTPRRPSNRSTTSYVSEFWTGLGTHDDHISQEYHGMKRLEHTLGQFPSVLCSPRTATYYLVRSSFFRKPSDCSEE